MSILARIKAIFKSPPPPRILNGGIPDWSKVAGASQKVVNPKKRVLMATSMGSHAPTVSLESLLTAALKVREAEVDVLLCDKVLPACLDCATSNIKDIPGFVAHGPQLERCDRCYANGRASFAHLGADILNFSEYLSVEDRAYASRLVETTATTAIGEFKLDGLAVGEHALAGCLRFFARSDLQGEALSAPVLKRYFAASILTKIAVEKVLRAKKYDVVVFNHGIYVPHGIIGEVARKLQIPVVNWTPSYRKNTFIFSHNDTYHHTLMSEPVAKWDRIELTKKTSI